MDRSRPTVYIPTINRSGMLRATLISLRAQTVPADVCVVDNASTDGTSAMLRTEFPEVKLIELPANMGFGPALNVGVREYPAEVIVFSNNDVECEPTFLEAMLEQLTQGTAAVAGVLRQHDVPELIDSAGVVIDRALLDFDHLRGEPVESAVHAPAPLGPTGAAAMYRFDAFRDAGGFDDRIFAYLEDVDLALRIRATGGSCRLAPLARATHHHSATLGSGSTRKNELIGWSRGYLLRRYGVLRQPSRCVRAVTCDVAVCTGQLLIDHTVSGFVGRLRGWRAARGLPSRQWPSGGQIDISTWAALRRRLMGGMARRRGKAQAP